MEDGDPTIIPPGSTAQFPATLTTDGESGTVARVVTVSTSDPKLPRIDFKVTARIDPPR